MYPGPFGQTQVAASGCQGNGMLSFLSASLGVSWLDDPESPCFPWKSFGKCEDWWSEERCLFTLLSVPGPAPVEIGQRLKPTFGVSPQRAALGRLGAWGLWRCLWAHGSLWETSCKGTRGGTPLLRSEPLSTTS